MRHLLRLLALLSALLLGTSGLALAQSPPPGRSYPGTLTLNVDARQVGQRLFDISLRIPVQPGLLKLHYPRWLPGHHGPAGDVSQIAGLVVEAGGRRLAWQRDAIDVFRFDIQVPEGVRELNLRYHWIGAADAAAASQMSGESLLSVIWTGLVLYPAGHDLRGISVAAQLRLPEGWRWAGALREAGSTPPGAPIRFMTENLETLFDSPIYAGPHLQTVALDPAGRERPVTLQVISDNAEAKAPSEEQLQAHRRLVEQADKLFGARPWRHYDLLIANAKGLPHIALEHQESSENAFPGNYWDDWAAASRIRDDVAHEFVHAWNGKHRRPADLWATDLNTATGNSLLWVYEGLTQYWGLVLSARSGLLTHDQVQLRLARYGAWMADHPGRAWRPLQDTTHENNIHSEADRRFWDYSRGSGDYYTESALLLWLEADTLIRTESQGQRSLDDFARQFFGATASQRGTVLYQFDDVVAALNAVHPHDWRGFLRHRMDRIGASAPLEGLTRGGWRVEYLDKRTPLMLGELDPDKPTLQLTYSLGAGIGKEGRINNVRWQGPAFRADMLPGDQIVAVGMQAWSVDRIEAALVANRQGGKPVELLMKRGERYRLINLDVQGGPRYPSLARIPDTLDRLGEILSPR